MHLCSCETGRATQVYYSLIPPFSLAISPVVEDSEQLLELLSVGELLKLDLDDDIVEQVSQFL